MARDTQAGRPELVDRIRREIERVGPITFERFMAMALYEPELGYYTARATASNQEIADYQTSPEVHPAFGDLIGGEVLRIWALLGRPNPLIIAEPGAGDGTLARQILAGIAERSPNLKVHYHAADVRLEASLGSGPCETDLQTWKSLDLLSNSNVKAHFVVSNEFFDALPVHRIYGVAESFREIYVAWQERGFAEQLGPASGAALEALAVAERPDPADGWRGEACAVLNPVVQAIARLVARGVVLTIDYGYGDDESDLATPGGSLIAYRRHQWTQDIFRRVGEQDLTSHVDFRALLRLGRRSGLEPAGAVSQREFLLGRGLASDAEDWARRESTPGRQWQGRFAMTDLVKSSGLGRLRVVAQQKGVHQYQLNSGPGLQARAAG